MRTIESIRVTFERYEPEEFVRFSAGDEDVVRPILERCGPLGRSPGVIRNQLAKTMQAGRNHDAKGGAYNYAEVKYAASLVDRGWPPDGLVYENYYLTAKAKRAGTGLKAQGSRLVRQALTDEFLDDMSRLIELNRGYFAKKREPDECHVDLFGWDAAGRRVGLWEMKRCHARGRTEVVGAHQVALLAMAGHLIRTRPERALKDPGTGADIGLVVFVPPEVWGSPDRERLVAPAERTCMLEVDG